MVHPSRETCPTVPREGKGPVTPLANGSISTSADRGLESPAYSPHIAQSSRNSSPTIGQNSRNPSPTHTMSDASNDSGLASDSDLQSIVRTESDYEDDGLDDEVDSDAGELMVTIHTKATAGLHNRYDHHDDDGGNEDHHYGQGNNSGGGYDEGGGGDSTGPGPVPPPPPQFRTVTSTMDFTLRPTSQYSLSLLSTYELDETDKDDPSELEERSCYELAEEAKASIDVSTLRKNKVSISEFIQYFKDNVRRSGAEDSNQTNQDVGNQNGRRFNRSMEPPHQPGGKIMNCINQLHSSGMKQGSRPSASYSAQARLDSRNGARNEMEQEEEYGGTKGTMTIRSNRGTVRGVRNLVRVGIQNFLLDQKKKDLRDREKDRLVVFMTSCGIIRETSARCNYVTKILRNMMIRYEERDVFMSRLHLADLAERLAMPPPHSLPLVFIHGDLLGDASVIDRLNEAGQLKPLVNQFKDPERCVRTCEKCGGFNWLPCPACSGSKKSGHRNKFSQVALRCTNCDMAGLVACDLCHAD